MLTDMIGSLRVHGLVWTALVGYVIVYGLGQPGLLQSCSGIVQSGLGCRRPWKHMVTVVV